MNTQATQKGRGLKWYVIAPLVSIVISLLLMYISAVLLSAGTISMKLMADLAIASVFLGATVGGLIAGKKRGSGVIIAGAAVGVGLAVLIFLGTVLSPNGSAMSASFVRMLLASLAGGLFGGTLCMGKGKRRSSTKKKKSRRYNRQ